MASHNNNERVQSQLGQGAPHLFGTRNLHLQTPGVDITNNNDPPTSGGHRSRGRPLGSKNKPKTPVTVTQDIPNAFHSQVIEISAGVDVIKSLSDFADKRERGINILSGKGMVAHVAYRQTEGNIMTLHGRYEILSISGTILPISKPILPIPTPLGGVEGLVVYLSGGPGQMIGGYAVSPLVTLSPLVLFVASFANPMFDRLPLFPMDPLVNSQPSSDVVATRLVTEGAASGTGIPLPRVDGSTEGRILISNTENPGSSSTPGHLFGWPITTVAATTTTVAATSSDVTVAPPSKTSPF